MSLSSQNENDPWVELVSVHEVEAWLAFQNQELARLLENKASVGQGLCLQLKLGGEIFCHTNQEGEILLELSDEALCSECRNLFCYKSDKLQNNRSQAVKSSNKSIKKGRKKAKHDKMGLVSKYFL